MLAANNLHGDSRISTDLADSSSSARDAVSLALVVDHNYRLSNSSSHGSSFLETFGSRKKAVTGFDRTRNSGHVVCILGLSYRARGAMAFPS
jgi:hypothetical protein